MTRNEKALTTMVSSTIVEFYNAYTAQPVKKFQDKATAIRRTAAVLDEAGMEFNEFFELKPVAEEKMPPKLNFNDDKQHEIDSAHMVDEKEPAEESVDLGQLGEFGLGDSEESAECPHCGINHRYNGYQCHGDDYECDERVHACLACGNEWGKPIKRRASTDRQPTLKGQRLAVVGGKDAANPFREGSKSHATFAMVQANPGKTYEELRDMGARMRTITHSTKQGWIRAL